MAVLTLVAFGGADVGGRLVAEARGVGQVGTRLPDRVHELAQTLVALLAA